MAKIKCKINEDSTLIKFGSLQNGEIFIMNGKACMKIDKIYIGAKIHYLCAVCLEDREIYELPDDELVTYVKKAELKLTI